MNIKRQRSQLKKPFVVATSILSMVVIWWLLSLISVKTVFPPPWTVFLEVWNILSTGEFLQHMIKTTIRILVGFTFSMVISFLISELMNKGEKLEAFIGTYVLIGLTIPALAWGIICVMWFGLNDLAAIIAIIVLTVPMIAFTLVQGIKAIDKKLLEMAEIYHARREMVIRKIILPQLLPSIFSSSRYGLGLAWKTVVIVEMLGLTDGIGYMIYHSFSVLNMKKVIAWTFLFTVIMLILEYGIIAPIENRLTKWRPRITL
jgi:NitT/TauT family transport system permease protein